MMSLCDLVLGGARRRHGELLAMCDVNIDKMGEAFDGSSRVWIAQALDQILASRSGIRMPKWMDGLRGWNFLPCLRRNPFVGG